MKTSIKNPIYFQSDGEVINLVASFEDGSLLKAHWNHQIFLLVTLCYLRKYPPEQAFELLRERIRRYNASAGIESTEPLGYHETLVYFWLREVDNFLKRQKKPFIRLFHLANLLSKSKCMDPFLPFVHYSAARINSTEAKHKIVEPDLKPIP